MLNVRTDLALESREMYKEKNNKEADGVILEEKEINGTKINMVRIINENGAEKLGKPIGNYITLDIPQFTEYDGELMDSVSKVLGKILKELANVKKDDKVLVIGLGNWNVTPDALGPKVVEGIMVTRHLSQVMPEVMEENIISVAAISPGVLGTTGIETVEVVKALVENIKPSLIICIDALAARRIQRLNKTIQISDTGISPGAGVGNHRKAINKEELGVKVIAVGVPTVVDASTIANDAMDMV